MTHTHAKKKKKQQKKVFFLLTRCNNGKRSKKPSWATDISLTRKYSRTLRGSRPANFARNCVCTSLNTDRCVINPTTRGVLGDTTAANARPTCTSPSTAIVFNWVLSLRHARTGMTLFNSRFSHPVPPETSAKTTEVMPWTPTMWSSPHHRQSHWRMQTPMQELAPTSASNCSTAYWYKPYSTRL